MSSCEDAYFARVWILGRMVVVVVYMELAKAEKRG